MPMLVAIALVHMDVVDTVAGCEAEDVVWRVKLRAPARAVGMEPAGRVGSQALDVKIELVDEIVARTGTVGRDAPHVAAVEHAAALVVQCEPARSRLDGDLAVGDARQPQRDVVAEVIVGEVEEIGLPGVTRAGARVDRDSEALAATLEQDVIVRSLAPGLRLPVDDSAPEDAVALVCHASLLGTQETTAARKLNAWRSFRIAGTENPSGRDEQAAGATPASPANRSHLRSRSDAQSLRPFATQEPSAGLESGVAGVAPTIASPIPVPVGAESRRPSRPRLVMVPALPALLPRREPRSRPGE